MTKTRKPARKRARGEPVWVQSLKRRQAIREVIRSAMLNPEEEARLTLLEVMESTRDARLRTIAAKALLQGGGKKTGGTEKRGKVALKNEVKKELERLKEEKEREAEVEESIALAKRMLDEFATLKARGANVSDMPTLEGMLRAENQEVVSKEN